MGPGIPLVSVTGECARRGSLHPTVHDASLWIHDYVEPRPLWVKPAQRTRGDQVDSPELG